MTDDRKTILYAEDDGLMRDTLKRTLWRKFSDYDVEYFENGGDLDERISKGLEDVCLVVTDNQMPLMTGSEVIKKHAGSNPDVPFILYYGGDQILGETAVEEYGVYDFVLKGAEATEKLFSSVNEALKSREYETNI